jgi:hypothetical protein
MINPVVKIIVICSVSLFFAVAGCSVGRKAEIVGLLLEVKHDEQAKSAGAAEETKNFLKAKDALLKAGGRLQPVDETNAREVFGEPVSVFKRGSSVVWAYKPSSSDWFRGEKIYLTFDEHGMLASAEYQPS